eukprot:sb/3479397/
MATFDTIKPELKAYLLKHRLPDIFERNRITLISILQCIFTGLAASRPEDPNQFILSRLREYQAGKHFDLEWDSFVNKQNLPTERVFKKSFIENFFTLEDLAKMKYYFYFQPSVEQKRKAAQAYNDNMIKKHFQAWLGYYNKKLEKRRKERAQWELAVQFYDIKLIKRCFVTWDRWKCERFASQMILAEKRKRIALPNYPTELATRLTIHLVCRAWKVVVKHASDRNLWFKKVEVLNLFLGRLPARGTTPDEGREKVDVRAGLNPPDPGLKLPHYPLYTIDMNPIKMQTNDNLVANLAHKFRYFLCNLSLRDCVGVSPSSIKFIGECRNLQELNLSGVPQLDADTVNEIGIGCKNLLYLNIAGTKMDDGVLRMLARHFVNLQYLSLAGCTGFTTAGIYYFMVGQGLHKLSHLDISNCKQITHEGMKMTSLKNESLYFFTKCHNLAYARFCYSEFVTDAGVELLANMQTLRSLDLSGCAVGDSGLASLGNNPNFRDISLSECNLITDVGIQKMTSRLLLLETLDISYCVNVTDYATKFLAFSCRELVRLNIAGCSQLTDTSVSYISGGCHYLSHLNLSNNTNITDKAVRFLRRGCGLLRRLNLQLCPKITYAAITRVEGGGYKVNNSIDVNALKLGPMLPLSRTHKRPMSVGYSIFPIPGGG